MGRSIGAERARGAVATAGVVAAAVGLLVAGVASAGAAGLTSCKLGSLSQGSYNEGLYESGTTCAKARAVAAGASSAAGGKYVARGFHCAGRQGSGGISPYYKYTCTKGKSARVQFVWVS